FGRYAQNSVGLSWYRVLRENELEQEPDGDGNLHRYDLEEASNQVRLNAGFEIVPGRLRLGTQLNYNLLGFPVEGEIRYLQSQAYGLSYTGDCYAMDLSFVERQFQGAPIQEIRFALSLKNVGTLLDLKSGVGGNV